MGEGDYSCRTALPAAKAEVAFAGPFAGREIRWRMTLYTLPAYYAEHASAAQRAAGVLQVRPFIQVQPETNGERALTVALPLAAIDEPAVRKAVIMIRQYRRLREGRHEYGAALSLNVEPG
jgi:hypothetical protein